jgi:MFS family permease
MPDATARMLDSVTAAGVVCLVYAVYCAFALPKTPPKGNDRKFDLFEALALFRHRSFTVLMIAALLLSVVHTIYFMQMGSFLKTAGLQAQNVMPAMSLGQVSEILMLAILGPMLAKLGFRMTMAIGAGAFALRYFLFSMQLPVEAFVAAQTLHGICFGCFYASAFIYVDRLAPVTVRHSAQALFGFVMYGLGPIIAAQVNGLFASYAVREGEKMNMAGYGTYWLGTAVIALIATVLIGIAFRDESAEREG